MAAEDEHLLRAAVSAGWLAPDLARALLDDARRSGQPVGDLLIARGAVHPEQLRQLQAARVPPPAPTPGARYQARGELGRGGMGRVMRVLDPRAGREVARKELHDAGRTPQARARFAREARITARLEHPGIVPVYEVEEAGGQVAAYTMKLIRGRSLQELLGEVSERGEREETRLQALVRVLLRVCEAVGYAHSCGVIHRDLKPANVMLGDFGEVLVVDWGLARASGEADPGRTESAGTAADGDAGVTQAGTLLGTPAYMPPEQIDGAEVDARADVYALGAILFQVLALRPPFQGTSAPSVLKRALLEPPPAPASVAPPGRRVPRELAAVALRCLEKDPARRYPDVPALAADLTRWLEGHPVTALPEGALGRARKWLARHPGAALSACVALAASAAVLGVAGLASRQRADAAQREGTLARRAEEEARTRSELEARARIEAEARAGAALRRSEAEAILRRLSPLLAQDVSSETLRERLIPGLQEALAHDPDLTDARVSLGECLLRLRDTEAGIAALQEADARARELAARTGGPPGSARALFLLGREAELNARSGDASKQAEAEAWFRRAREVDPADPLARAGALYLPGSDPEAARALAGDHPDLPEVQLAAAWSLARLEPFQRERADEALRHLDAARRLLRPGLERRVQLIECAANRADLLIGLGRPREAEEALAEARAWLSQSPELADSGLAATLARQETRALAARGELPPGTVGEVEGLDLDATLQRTRAQLARDPGGAIPWLVRLQGLCRDDPALGLEVCSALALAHWERGEPQAALADMSRRPAADLGAGPRLLDAIPGWDARWIRTLGGLLRSGPEPAQATALEQELAGLLEVASSRADASFRAQRWEDALLQAEQGLQAAEGLGEGEPARLAAALNLLGRAAVAARQLGRLERAEEHLRHGLRLNPCSDGRLTVRAGWDRYNLAVLLCERGAGDPALRSEALGLLEQAVDQGARDAARFRVAALQPLAGEERFQALLERLR